jgi:hypothetical protein
MNGFAEAAVSLAYIANLAAVSTILSLGHAGAPQSVTEAIHGLPPVAQIDRAHVVTQKLMRNPWDRTGRYLLVK